MERRAGDQATDENAPWNQRNPRQSAPAPLRLGVPARQTRDSGLRLNRPIMDVEKDPTFALVLSGGGARGAYEAGVIYYLRTRMPKEIAGSTLFKI